MTHDTARRGFLRGLATLPLIGGGIALVGQPTGAAVPLSDQLLNSYDAWLFYERRYLRYEFSQKRPWITRPVDRADVVLDFDFEPDMIRVDNPGGNFHVSADPLKAPQPSSRAAVVLAAAGCEWRQA